MSFYSDLAHQLREDLSQVGQREVAPFDIIDDDGPFARRVIISCGESEREVCVSLLRTDMLSIDYVNMASGGWIPELSQSRHGGSLPPGVMLQLVLKDANTEDLVWRTVVLVNLLLTSQDLVWTGSGTELRKALGRLSRLLKAVTVSRAERIGWWGELAYLCSLSPDTRMKAIGGWASNPLNLVGEQSDMVDEDETIDFCFEHHNRLVAIEVKTTTGSLRRHHVSVRQVRSSSSKQVVLASLLMSAHHDGQNLSDLVDTVLEGLPLKSDDSNKLREALVRRNNELQAVPGLGQEERYSLAGALQSLRHLSLVPLEEQMRGSLVLDGKLFVDCSLLPDGPLFEKEAR